MDYAKLQTTIADFLNRLDLEDQVPQFIELTESRIRRDVRESSMQTRAETMIASEYFELPCDWVSTIRITVDGNVLRLADGYNMERFELIGVPSFYRHVEHKLQFLPPPDNAKPLRCVIEYMAEIPHLSEENPTNWLLERYPDVYLYGSLLTAAGYLNDDVRVPLWQSAYGEAVAAANLASEKAEYSGVALRLQRHGCA